MFLPFSDVGRNMADASARDPAKNVTEPMEVLPGVCGAGKINDAVWPMMGEGNDRFWHATRI